MTQTFADVIISEHALFEMSRRSIEKSIIDEILASPDAVRAVREGRVVLHKTLIAPSHKKALLYRLFLDIDRIPPVVVTVYATSKIAKYEAIQ